MKKDVNRCLNRALSELRAGENDRAFVALHDAITVLNESAVHKSEKPPDPRVFRHDWTDEELRQMGLTYKPLTLADLKRQVDAALSAFEFRQCGPDWNPETRLLWIIGDFEIRRRK